MKRRTNRKPAQYRDKRGRFISATEYFRRLKISVYQSSKSIQKAAKKKGAKPSRQLERNRREVERIIKRVKRTIKPIRAKRPRPQGVRQVERGFVGRQVIGDAYFIPKHFWHDRQTKELAREIEKIFSRYTHKSDKHTFFTLWFKFLEEKTFVKEKGFHSISTISTDMKSANDAIELFIEDLYNLIDSLEDTLGNYGMSFEEVTKVQLNIRGERHGKGAKLKKRKGKK